MSDGQFPYAQELQYWQFMVKRLMSLLREACLPLIRGLTPAAEELRLPILYNDGQSIAWATACQAFLLTYQHRLSVGRVGFTYLTEAIDQAVRVEGFTEEAFARIVQNAKSPAAKTRSIEEVVVDTFIMAAACLRDEVQEAKVDHAAVTHACLTSPKIHNRAKFICIPAMTIGKLNEEYATGKLTFPGR